MWQEFYSPGGHGGKHQDSSDSERFPVKHIHHTIIISVTVYGSCFKQWLFYMVAVVEGIRITVLAWIDFPPPLFSQKWLKSGDILGCLRHFVPSQMSLQLTQEISWVRVKLPVDVPACLGESLDILSTNAGLWRDFCPVFFHQPNQMCICRIFHPACGSVSIQLLEIGCRFLWMMELARSAKVQLLSFCGERDLRL